MPNGKTGTYYSWSLLNETMAIKITDKSVFESHGSGIPKETRWFWEVENIRPSQKKDLTFLFNGDRFKAYINLEIKGRTRLFWYSDLNKLFRKEYGQFLNDGLGEFPSLLFEKINMDIYKLSFIPVQIFEIEHTPIIDANDNNINVSAAAYEGKRVVFCSTKYERSSKNRKDCIKIHGLKCSVCGFDFEEAYGEWGKNYIEVHHIAVLHTLGGIKKINPKTDLTPVCANCHRMLHRKKNQALTTDELRSIIRNRP